MENRLLKHTALFSAAFTVLALCTIVFFNGTRWEVSAGQNTEAVCIPLPKGVAEADVQIQNDYRNKEIRVTIHNASSDLALENEIQGNTDKLKNINYEMQDGLANIIISMHGLYEVKAVYKQDKLYLEFLSPKEMYEQIIVIDAGHGGERSGTEAFGQLEKDISLGIAMQLKKILDGTDIKAYYTRTSDVDTSEEDRLLFAEATGADMFISIHTNADERTRATNGTKVLYNNSVSGNQPSGIRQAEILAEKITGYTGSKSRGVEDGTDDVYLLQKVGVPAAMIEVGYLTNKHEAIEMSETHYQEKVAQGIYDAIVEIYGELKSD